MALCQNLLFCAPSLIGHSMAQRKLASFPLQAVAGYLQARALLDEEGDPLYSKAYETMGFPLQGSGILALLGSRRMRRRVPITNNLQLLPLAGYTPARLCRAAARMAGWGFPAIRYGSGYFRRLVDIVPLARTQQPDRRRALQNSPTLLAAQSTLLEAEENLRAGAGRVFTKRVRAVFRPSGRRSSSASNYRLPAAA